MAETRLVEVVDDPRVQRIAGVAGDRVSVQTSSERFTADYAIVGVGYRDIADQEVGPNFGQITEESRSSNSFGSPTVYKRTPILQNGSQLATILTKPDGTPIPYLYVGPSARIQFSEEELTGVSQNFVSQFLNGTKSYRASAIAITAANSGLRGLGRFFELGRQSNSSGAGRLSPRRKSNMLTLANGIYVSNDPNSFGLSKLSIGGRGLQAMVDGEMVDVIAVTKVDSISADPILLANSKRTPNLYRETVRGRNTVIDIIDEVTFDLVNESNGDRFRFSRRN